MAKAPKSDTNPAKPVKQAVVVVHGMGEQVPMQTLESFVDAVWTTDDTLTPGDHGGQNPSWGKPDRRNRSFELRRITTGSGRTGRRTDFYEFYWAHLMKGNTWEHVKGWIVGLLFRKPFSQVPRRVLPAWVLLWLISLVALAAMAWGLLPEGSKSGVWNFLFDTDMPAPGALSGLITGGLGLLISALVSNVLVKRFGDVARYVTASPPNVDRRQEIREKGVELLQTLTDSKQSDGVTDSYDRIIVVAHSLGTIVAYDILTHFFARQNRGMQNGQPQPERDAMERMIRAAAGLPVTPVQTDGTDPAPDPLPLDFGAFQDQQAACFREAQAQGGAWKISDFVTLGAPLTHAEFLMAKTREDMRDKQARRVLPTCPPVLEASSKTGLKHFAYGGSSVPAKARTPHHAALFAYTRWTNLYSDHRLIVLGDIISGPVGSAFGLVENGQELRGIRDVAVLPALEPDGRKRASMKWPFFSHNNYWRGDKPAESYDAEPPHHIAELRKALRLGE